jgi:hypothetical protein
MRILALHGRDGMHGVRAPDRLLPRFRETEEARLPFAHDVGHGAHDILDWDGRIDAMLVEQVDAIRLEAAQ